jgi:hypothetical protein
MAKTTKRTTKKTASRARASQKRELIDTGSDKRFVKRGGSGRFRESDDVGQSLTADRRRRAKTAVTSGFGDQGDRPRKRTAKKR